MSKDFFNARAAIWDEKVAESDPLKLEAMAARLDIKPGADVLDVGTGTGVFIPYLLKKIGPTSNLVCLDFAEEMLRRARSKGFQGNISYLCADVMDSGLPGSAFDAVVCYSVFPHFRDRPGALREINRLLKKDGRIYICHTSGREAINRIHRGMPEVCDHLIPGNEEMQCLLTGAGFSDIAVEDGPEDYFVSARKAV